MSGEGVEIRHLRALVAVAEAGTFTGAATRLGVSQPAVSRTILSLEQALGADLVSRTTRRVALTEAGERAYRAATVALTALDDVVAAADARVRPLRMGYAWSALGRHTSTVLRTWRHERPDVPLEVHRVDTVDGGLATGTADVAVIRGEFRPADCDVREVFREPRMAVLPTGHRLAGQESVLLGELRDETVVTTAYGVTRAETWPPDERPRTMLKVGNTDEWITEIAGGLGIGVTAESTAAQHAHPGVVFVPIDDLEWLCVLLAWPTRHAHPSTSDFVELVARTVADAHAD